MTEEIQEFTVARNVANLGQTAPPLYASYTYGLNPMRHDLWPVSQVVGAGPEAKQLVDIWETLGLGHHEPLEWSEFLHGLEGGSVGLSSHHAERVREVWRELRAAIGPRLPLPQATSRDDGQIAFAWSRPEIYAEIEIHPDRTYEWFARDRTRDRHDGSSEPQVGALDERLLKLLAKVRKG